MAGGFDVAFLDREMCGTEIVSMRFERPDGYSYAPGQWFRLNLETADGLRAETFSHASAPSDPFLQLTTRVTGSPYKRALMALAPGTRVNINGPGGRLALHDEVARVAFLVGGIGITPVRSMLRDAKARGRRFADALLLYGNRDDSCAPFLGELAAMTDIGVRVAVCYETPPPGWLGEAGFITAEMVRRHVDAADGRPFYVTGPPVMVAAMERVLDELGTTDDRRVIERFTPNV